ncbi:DNA-protecting protein DprA [candidate division KSB1 bacterium]|nr:DNA-protecting protein DprA [candidate division KSB1 bacterium]NIR72991.1 DNA-protecting protein DprA [candidate division KSB1 bacterium]NIS27744.1 DNA-protecting protein DprA [candidate division KSB1 bacterium]NIT74592.1 DNA-protecting protein DprA [candidate division KSB1 bacterium]NIU28411.1 DNA-protecting protein DprA [candidate division KSB1 bacterium]
MESIKPEILLRLSAVPGIGPNKIRALIGRFGFSEGIFRAAPKELSGLIDRKTAERLHESDDKAFAEKQIEAMHRHGVKLITFWHKEYPSQLKHIYDPPAYLFVKGCLTATDKFSVGVVGTRQPSNYGKLVTEKLTSDLARKGLTIVSGMAYGIDTIAHTSALNSGGRTLAILGSGLDVIYPSRNKALAERISSQGAVISEFPMGTKPDWQNFPRRNRIICGLSLGTLVVEAGAKSGALITAAMALEQNKEVFAVPGNIESPSSVGTNDLIKQGAKLVTSTEDIFEELEHQLKGFHQQDEQVVDGSTLNESEKKLIRILDNEPKHVDAIAKEAGQSTAQVLSVLLSLELKNLVKQLAGKQFVRI